MTGAHVRAAMVLAAMLSSPLFAAAAAAQETQAPAAPLPVRGLHTLVPSKGDPSGTRLEIGFTWWGGDVVASCTLRG